MRVKRSRLCDVFDGRDSPSLGYTCEVVKTGAAPIMCAVDDGREVRLRERDQTSRADWTSAAPGCRKVERRQGEKKEKARESLHWRARNSAAVVEEVWCCKRASGAQTLLKPGREWFVVRGEPARGFGRSNVVSTFHKAATSPFFASDQWEQKLKEPGRAIQRRISVFLCESRMSLDANCTI